MVDPIKKIMETFAKKPKQMERVLANHLKRNPPQLNAPPQAFPNYSLLVKEVNINTGYMQHPIKDWARFRAYLKMNTPVFDPEIAKEADKIVEALKLQEEKQKEMNRAKHTKLMEARKASFWNIKLRWESRHYYKDVYSEIKNLSAEDRSKLKAQILKGDHPARFSQTDKDNLITFLTSLENKN